MVCDDVVLDIVEIYFDVFVLECWVEVVCEYI